MDLASIFSEMLGANARLCFQIGLRTDDIVHTWYLSHFLIMNEKGASLGTRLRFGGMEVQLLHEDSCTTALRLSWVSYMCSFLPLKHLVSFFKKSFQRS